MNNTTSLRTCVLRTGLLFALPITAHSYQMKNHFDDRPQATGNVVTLTASNTSATVEPDEPSPTHDKNRTVWAEWIAPADGRVTIDTLGTTFSSPMVTVHAGNELSKLTCIAHSFDPNGPTPANVGFPVTAGTAYQIRLASNYTSAHGAGTVNIRLTPGATPSSFAGSDHFDSRLLMTGHQAYGVAGNHFATVDAYEPESFGYADQTVWWEWTAPATGKVTLDTLESDFNTTITVYAADPEETTPFAGLAPSAPTATSPTANSPA